MQIALLFIIPFIGTALGASGVLFLKNGEVVDKHVGSTNEGDLRKKLEALL